MKKKKQADNKSHCSIENGCAMCVLIPPTSVTFIANYVELWLCVCVCVHSYSTYMVFCIMKKPKQNSILTPIWTVCS